MMAGHDTAGDQAVVKERFFRPTRKEAHVNLYPRFSDFHKLRMRGDYEYPLHQHANYEVVLVENGPYRCRLNGSELTLTDGQALVVKPGDWHQDHLRDGQYHLVLHFELHSDRLPGGRNVELFLRGGDDRRQICGGSFHSEIGILGEIEAEAVRPGPYSPAIQDALLEAIFWRIARALPEEGLSAQFKRLSADQRFVDRLQEALSRHEERSLAVEDLSRALEVSRRTLTEKCRRLLGETPAGLILRAKMERARALLTHTDLPVKDISFRLGFKNPYHFSKAFKRLVGHSPRGERERVGLRRSV